MAKTKKAVDGTEIAPENLESGLCFCALKKGWGGWKKGDVVKVDNVRGAQLETDGFGKVIEFEEE